MVKSINNYTKWSLKISLYNHMPQLNKLFTKILGYLLDSNMNTSNLGLYSAENPKTILLSPLCNLHCKLEMIS